MSRFSQRSKHPSSLLRVIAVPVTRIVRYDATPVLDTFVLLRRTPKLTLFVRRACKVIQTDIDWLNKALRLASFEGRLELVEQLLHHGADVNSRADDGDQESLLLAAARRGYVGVMRLLLDGGADVNT